MPAKVISDSTVKQIWHMWKDKCSWSCLLLVIQQIFFFFDKLFIFYLSKRGFYTHCINAYDWHCGFFYIECFFFCVLFISSGDGHALQRDIVKKLWRMFSSMVASLTMFRRQIVACLTEEEEKEKTTTR